MHAVCKRNDTQANPTTRLSCLNSVYVIQVGMLSLFLAAAQQVRPTLSMANTGAPVVLVGWLFR